MIVRAIIAATPAARLLPHRLAAAWPAHQLGCAEVRVPSGVPVLAQGGVLIIGQLFRHSAPVGALTPDLAAAIIDSRGRVLVDDYWGGYLALWQDRRDRAVHVLRDPSGAVPLFCSGQGDRALLFTDLDDVWPLPHGPAAVDWTGLAHRLLYPQLPAAPTALHDITALLPGQSARLDNTTPATQLWSPWRFAGREADAAPLATAAGAVRASVELATARLVPAAPVLLELSGGLDSSILAACLDAAGADWTPVTIVTPAIDGDERRFAEAVARRFGKPLTTLALTPADLDLLAMPRLRTTAPGGFGMLDGLDRAIGARIVGDGFAAAVSGTGGDNVFCALRSAAPVLDAWRDGGLAQVARTARDLGRLTGSNYWAVLRQTVRYARLDGDQPDRWTRDTRLLSADVRPPPGAHPWLAAPRRRSAAARAHIVMLLRAHAVAAAHDRARRHGMLLPLLAQPVVEACLSVPAWQWIADGCDRAVARLAFANRLPDLVLQRRSKGRLESLLAPAFDRDRRALCEMLADGRLAAAGVIDRSAVIAAFAAPASAIDDRYIRLLELADAELWLASVG